MWNFFIRENHLNDTLLWVSWTVLSPMKEEVKEISFPITSLFSVQIAQSWISQEKVVFHEWRVYLQVQKIFAFICIKLLVEMKKTKTSTLFMMWIGICMRKHSDVYIYYHAIPVWLCYVCTPNPRVYWGFSDSPFSCVEQTHQYAHYSVTWDALQHVNGENGQQNDLKCNSYHCLFD